jgi:hypothetical protein
MSFIAAHWGSLLLCGVIVVAAPGLAIWLWVRHLPTKGEK